MIMINLDAMLAKRKISSLELAQRIGITPANLSILKTGKAKAIRFSTLEAICHELECQPGDVLEFKEEGILPEDRTAMEGVAHFYRAVTGEEMPGDLTEPRNAFYTAIGASVEEEGEGAGEPEEDQ